MTSRKRRLGSASEQSSASLPPAASSPSKRVKAEAAATTLGTQVCRLNSDHPVWPAPAATMDKAAEFLQRAARSGERILLVPDKDVDGLSAGLIVKRTLLHLGAPPESIVEHHIPAGKNPNSPSEREALEAYRSRWIIVLDQGSPAGPPLVRGAEKGWLSDEEDAVRTMVLDHHYVSDLEAEGPTGSLLLNACKSEPVSTSALLAWVVCRPMWDDGTRIDYLAVLGTCGDLSINVKWDEPWPDLSGEVRRWGKSKLGQAIAMLNAPRRTPTHDAVTSWVALDASTNPLDILHPSTNPSFGRLSEARQMVREETEKCTHTPPRFSKDGRVALLTIHSPYQVHPSVATRWSGSLRGAKKLQVVMCANAGFGALFASVQQREEACEAEEGQRYVHFSCRIANAAKARGESPNIIELLHEYAAMDPTFLSDLRDVGEDQFARGHKEASGGILPPAFWRRFVGVMQIGVKPSPAPDGVQRSPGKKGPAQNNKLTNYFKAGG